MPGKFRTHLVFMLVIIFCLCVKVEAVESNTIASQDFLITKDTIIVPIEKLRPSEKISCEMILREIQQISTDKNLEPLKVIERGDGNYTIIEGNKTFSAMKELGVKNFPVIVRPFPYQKNVKNIQDLYSLNFAAEDEFNSLMKNLQAELGGELSKRPTIKAEKRVREKTELKLNGDYSAVTDLWAASLIYPDEESLLAAFEKLKNRDDVVKINDRWHNPLPQGYKDIQLKIILSNGAIMELQLHHKTAIEVKNGLDHYIYEFRRANAKNSEMQICVERAKNIQKTLYDSVWNGSFSEIDAETKKILGDIAKQLSTQKSPRDAAILLNRLEEILKNSLEEYELAA